ncbi:MAG: endonuclease/exonuclease/phosphatase family protein [Chitinophagaceae bacterium]
MIKKISLVAIILFSTNLLFAQKLIVATYNVRYDNRGDSVAGNGWKQRCPIIADLIRFHDFDIFGTQEAKFNQLQDIQELLKGYARIGIGRDDGKEAGEFSAIFYKTEKFKLLKHGDFWMSTITDKPNKSWDAALPRICSWGQFQDIKTKHTFYFFNLHMDHIGVVARRESAKLVLDTIKKMAGNSPTILTGDFNVDQNNESYTLLNTSGFVKDSYELSPIKFALNGTFNSFNINAKTDSRIDHIFLTKNFSVNRYGILTDSYRAKLSDTTQTANSANFPREGRLGRFQAKLPSDHFPVMAEVQW